MVETEPYQFAPKEIQKMKPELEETRRCLLKMYHSDIQTHAGYLIGIIIGSLTVFSRLDAFFGSSAVFPHSSWVFLVLFGLIALAGFWTILRIYYWTILAGYVQGTPLNEIYDFFNKKNNERAQKKEKGNYFPVDLEPPPTVVIQWAIDRALDRDVREKKLGCSKKIALWTTRSPKRLFVIFVIVFAILVVVGLLLGF